MSWSSVLARVPASVSVTFSLFLIALAAGGLRVLLRMLLKAVLGNAFRRTDSFEEMRENAELERAYAQELPWLKKVEYVATVCGLIFVPVLCQFLVRQLLGLTGGPGDLVLFPGGPWMALPHVIAGVFLGAAYVPSLIRGRYDHPHADGILTLYQRSEDREYGHLGRFVLTRPLLLFFIFLLLPVPFAVANYTLIGPERIEISGDGPTAQRESLPNKELAHLFIVVTEKRSPRSSKSYQYFAEYRSGRLLSSKDALDDWGKRPRKALEELSRVTHLPITTLTSKEWEARRR